ncbi:MAG: hypothetical protein QNJ44_11735 [Rhodobacter sp.]|nr:hypothetical protein [Rhodobacter sp.]
MLRWLCFRQNLKRSSAGRVESILTDAARLTDVGSLRNPAEVTNCASIDTISASTRAIFKPAIEVDSAAHWQSNWPYAHGADLHPISANLR